jgi:hypothetical protein
VRRRIPLYYILIRRVFTAQVPSGMAGLLRPPKFVAVRAAEYDGNIKKRKRYADLY